MLQDLTSRTAASRWIKIVAFLLSARWIWFGPAAWASSTASGPNQAPKKKPHLSLQMIDIGFGVAKLQLNQSGFSYRLGLTIVPRIRVGLQVIDAHNAIYGGPRPEDAFRKDGDFTSAYTLNTRDTLLFIQYDWRYNLQFWGYLGRKHFEDTRIGAYRPYNPEIQQRETKYYQSWLYTVDSNVLGAGIGSRWLLARSSPERLYFSVTWYTIVRAIWHHTVLTYGPGSGSEPPPGVATPQSTRAATNRAENGYTWVMGPAAIELVF